MKTIDKVIFVMLIMVIGAFLEFYCALMTVIQFEIGNIGGGFMGIFAAIAVAITFGSLAFDYWKFLRR